MDNTNLLLNNLDLIRSALRQNIESNIRDVEKYREVIDDLLNKNQLLEDVIKEMEDKSAPNKGNVGPKASSNTANTLNPEDYAVKEDGYNPIWTWQQRVSHILNKSERPLTTTDVVAEVIRLEPRYTHERSKVVASVSAVLSVNSKEGGRYIKTQTVRGDNAFEINRKSEENNSETI
jgi:hypothetical protein